MLWLRSCQILPRNPLSWQMCIMWFYQSSQFRTVSSGMAKIFCFGTPSGTENPTEMYLLIFWSVSGSIGRIYCVLAEKIIPGRYMFYTDLTFSPSISLDLLHLLFLLPLSLWFSAFLLLLFLLPPLYLFLFQLCVDFS